MTESHLGFKIDKALKGKPGSLTNQCKNASTSTVGNIEHKTWRRTLKLSGNKIEAQNTAAQIQSVVSKFL